ncbi:hypothetical protein SADUNF_Sadunf19G0102600 [Salix dunnii]|uniref:Uncharacterized protein n=1 Tax=Salix dunnii TaxID=1413687 RepID=A0A835J6J6_9ROSI|nr:hypothetical protein SADUNF_Sadunf19G0102600 [Salix dunnii]
MQGQDLWEVVNRNEIVQPEAKATNCMFKKWKIKTTVDDDMPEHIRDPKTPKEAWDIFVKLFSKRNGTRL